MTEWPNYSLSDFLLFAPRTYYRLIESYNADLWPAQLAALAFGGAVLVLFRFGGGGHGRIVALILALAWSFAAWAFLLERYAVINWTAEYFAWGFAFQAALLLIAATFGGGIGFRRPAHAADRAGLGLFVFALAAYPLIAPLAGRAWTQAEIFGLAPDPTAVATLGLAVLAPGRWRWLLLPLPIAWCAIGGATLWAMKAPDALVMPLAGLSALALAIAKSGSRA